MVPTQRSHQASKLPVSVTRVPVIDKADDQQIVLRDELLLEATNRIFVRELLRRSGSVPVCDWSALASAVERSFPADDRVPARNNSAPHDSDRRGVRSHDATYGTFRFPDMNPIRKTVRPLALPRHANILLNTVNQFFASHNRLVHYQQNSVAHSHRDNHINNHSAGKRTAKQV